MFVRNATLALALAAALSVVPAQAQEPVATLTQVQGSVLVSQGEGMAAGSNGQKLTLGTRVVATSQSRAVIHYENGCDVVVPENSRATVEKDKPCAALMAAVTGLPTGAIGGTAGATAATVGGGLTGAAAGGMIAIGGAFGYGAYKSLVTDRETAAVSVQ